jgi:hypothetical protein
VPALLAGWEGPDRSLREVAGGGHGRIQAGRAVVASSNWVICLICLIGPIGPIGPIGWIVGGERGTPGGCGS